MTATARINQSDMDRLAKFVKRANIDRARIVLNPREGLIEISIGEPDSMPARAKIVDDGWDDPDD